jgi:hypothetical protein
LPAGKLRCRFALGLPRFLARALLLGQTGTLGGTLLVLLLPAILAGDEDLVLQVLAGTQKVHERRFVALAHALALGLAQGVQAAVAGEAGGFAVELAGAVFQAQDGVDQFIDPGGRRCAGRGRGRAGGGWPGGGCGGGRFPGAGDRGVRDGRRTGFR